MADAYVGEVTPNDPAIAGPLNTVNQALLAVLGPMKGAVMASPLPAKFKEDLYHRPVDALLGLFSPVEDLAVDAITFANDFSGKRSRTIGIPGVNQTVTNMDMAWPEDAQVTNPSVLAFAKRVRIINNFMILTYQDPVALNVGVAKALLKRGQWLQSEFDAFMSSLGIAPPPTPAQMLTDLNKLGTRMREAGSSVVTTVSADVKRLAAAVSVIGQYNAFLAVVGPQNQGLVNIVYADGDQRLKDQADKIKLAAQALSQDPAGLPPGISSMMNKVADGCERIKSNAADIMGRKNNKRSLPSALLYASMAPGQAGFRPEAGDVVLVPTSFAGHARGHGLSGWGGLGAAPAAAIPPAVAAIITAGVTAGIACTPIILKFILEVLRPGSGQVMDPNYRPQQPPQPAASFAGVPIPLLLGGALALVLLSREK